MSRLLPRGAWWALAGAGFLTLILLVVLWFPRLLRPDLSDVERDQLTQQGTDKLVAAENDRSNAQNSIRTTLLQGIAGVALLTGAYFAYRGLEASRLQLKATEDGQITTRYTEAVKQLGDKENVDIRIGGIYALQRIARDSDRDLPTVVALLSAFVRRSAPVKETAEESSPEGIPLSAQAPDVEIALEVLAEFGGAHLAVTNFHDTNLRGANLRSANLHGANLRGANLRGADLSGANLRSANLRSANLHGANLHGADLHGAQLHDANLGIAGLGGANLRRADLSGANLRTADLSGANLRTADLSGANLYGADLRGADFARADLTVADVDGAYVDGADFARAVGVDLRDVRGTPQFLPDGSPGKPVGDRHHDEADDGPK